MLFGSNPYILSTNTIMLKPIILEFLCFVYISTTDNDRFLIDLIITFRQKYRTVSLQ